MSKDSSVLSAVFLLDHVVALNGRHLERLPAEFVERYYHTNRPHQGLDGDTPDPHITPTALVTTPVLAGRKPHLPPPRRLNGRLGFAADIWGHVR